MIISIKDSFKMLGISIVCFCAVYVCALFVNYYLDLQLIENEIADIQAMTFYEAQTMTCKVVCGVTGGSLLLTSVVLLIFYIKHYIDSHNKELGILKALGYSNIKIAASFYTFGLSVLAGTALGYLGSCITMPKFYEVQNKDGFLPDVPINIHISVLLFFILAPAVLFAMLAILCSYIALKVSALSLIQGKSLSKVKKLKDDNLPFLEGLKRSTIKQRKSLVFFITFGSFCFSAMTQMSASMNDLSSEMMGMMMMIIGIVLACVALFLSLTSVMKANAKTVTMMKVFGYSEAECSRAIFGGYRIWNYLGFALGSAYQYLLLKIMVTIVFKDIEGIPEYNFDFKMCFITLIIYTLLYEILMKLYGKHINRMSVKEIMTE